MGLGSHNEVSMICVVITVSQIYKTSKFIDMENMVGQDLMITVKVLYLAWYL